MKYWYDLEFHEDGRTIDLISIGIVAEDGREYYAINQDCDWPRVLDNEWLLLNVVEHLPEVIDQSPDWKPHAQIAAEVAEFITGDRDDNELWAYYGAYDHVALCQLWGRMLDLPPSVPMFTCDIKQEHVRLGSPALPEQAAGEHHALADARHNRRMFDALALHAASA